MNIRRFFLFGLVLGLLAGCGASSDKSPTGPTQVHFADANLARLVQAVVAPDDGVLYESVVATVETLDASGQSIKRLDGIEALTNLRWLSLADNRIADLSPLVRLEQLRWLDVSGNQISDWGPMFALVGLDTLRLLSNPRQVLATDSLQDWLANAHSHRLEEDLEVETDAQLAHLGETWS